jgi:hypothetical protein
VLTIIVKQQCKYIIVVNGLSAATGKGVQVACRDQVRSAASLVQPKNQHLKFMNGYLKLETE